MHATEERVDHPNSAPASMGEREFWVIVRASLLNICSAIEKRYDIAARRREERVPEKTAR
jgi:hypothetical protein